MLKNKIKDFKEQLKSKDIEIIKLKAELQSNKLKIQDNNADSEFNTDEKITIMTEQ